MKLAIASTSLLALPTFNQLQENGHEVSILFSKPGKARGRGKVNSYNEITSMLRERNLHVELTESDSDITNTIISAKIELVVAISYGKLIKRAALAAPKYGWLNLHFSKLPQYRGAAPVQRAILDGNYDSGITVFKLDEGMDTGPIYTQSDFSLHQKNATDALAEMSSAGSHLVQAAIEMIQSGIEPSAQLGSSSQAPKVDKAELRIDWSRQSDFPLRQIRAFGDSPGAWSELDGKKIKILDARLSKAVGEPGVILNIEPLIVGLGSGSIEIMEVQAESSRRMLAREWSRGARIQVGNRFK